ncbi:DUF2312 domain-containing protein [Phyllobacterium sp. BT25]|uniref:DUF2312 domain-containing protein n=1 Tax=Phyllobacterium pellucidum TaxID=2740464 RepID=A0A849VRM8_9HYPH|nr:DUF2312 domain-containing protein [Phyllobacterium pellucidum]NTS30697.1 DUF2312 domain-containing protein [Phyllobacterium pellucidum]
MSAEAEIKQFIDRILRLKEEQDTLGEDIREVYAEAKGRGYDKTALGNVVAHLRKVEKVGRDTLHEREAIFDLYLTAYETGGRAPASARARENIEEFPVSAKLVATVANAVQTETGRKALIAAVDIMIEREAAEHIDPETGAITTSHGKAPDGMDPSHELIAANMEQGDVDSSASRASSAVEVGASNFTPDPSSLVVADGQPESSEPGSAKSDGSAIVGQGRESGNTITGCNSEQAVANFETPSFLKDQTKSIRDYRPHCQKPEACGASGLGHCYSCSKLIAVEGEVA